MCFPKVFGTCNSKRVLFSIEEIAKNKLTLKHEEALDTVQRKADENLISHRITCEQKL